MHASQMELYEKQDDRKADYNQIGKIFADQYGIVPFQSARQVSNSIPTRNTVRKIEETDRHFYPPADMHLLAVKPGFETLKPRST